VSTSAPTSGATRKAVKASVFDLQMDRRGPGLQLHRIDNSKDPNFWSARVNRDVRLIVHKTDESLLVAYVDHHDAAYAWAERRRIPTDAKLLNRAREKLVKLAKKCGVDLRQSYTRVTTTAFDRSSSRWLGISDLIAEPEGPSFISRTVARSRVDRLRS
jgi:hypothetical protein